MYKEYINNRETDLLKLSELIPEIVNILPIVTEGIKISKKYAETFDKIKLALEKHLRHTLEYAEVDVYFQCISGLIVSSEIAASGNPELIIEDIFNKLNGIFPNCEINSESLKKDTKVFTEKILDKVFED